MLHVEHDALVAAFIYAIGALLFVYFLLGPIR